MQLLIYSSYAHIFWIPLFPYKKSAMLYCGHCQKVTEEKTLESKDRQKIKALKSSVPTPKYMFAGLVIIILAIAGLTFNSSQQEKKQQAFINAPLVGDVYKLKDETELSDYKYYLLKVVAVDEDSIDVSASSFSYNGLPDKLEAEDGFYDVSYRIDRQFVKELYDKKELLKVERDYSDYTGFNRVIQFVPDTLIQENVDESATL
ncbi:hypothetical protein [Fulvivirga aurantia]|uniref:hypothetical protein n=1 Tax=Fulvivirga aurantia TaxID=2529383 RepID=UPI001624B2BA